MGIDKTKNSQSFLAPSELAARPELDRAVETTLPLLAMEELGESVVDLRDQLTPEDQSGLRDEEIVVRIQPRNNSLPAKAVTPLEIVMKAAGASMPEEIGFMGPTVASVDIKGGEEVSRYERQHGRDDLIAGDDLKSTHPQLLDTVVASLASTQGTEYERFVPGMPYGFEKPGSIILVDFAPDDPLGQKFQRCKDWRPRFYGSVDAPGLFVAAVADLQKIDPDYLLKRTYTAMDGTERPISAAFDLSVLWLIERMDENPQGLIEYQNPYNNGRGMRNQGWKDSADAMVHKNGDWVNAQGGVAPIEVQCQAIISLRKAAAIHRSVHSNEVFASELEARAENLWSFIINNGWVQDEQGGYFATGWDRDENGNLRRIETRSIDMHAVLRVLDVADPEQKDMARSTVRALTSPDMFTRWGSRVMSSREVAYGHMRYHCGVWPDKSNRVAESMSSIGLYGLDRGLGQCTTDLIRYLGCVPEHISGEDNIVPLLPEKDLYVYNRKYNELHLAEQVPPLGQTWGATSEISKQSRYERIPMHADSEEDQRFEAQILASLQERYA